MNWIKVPIRGNGIYRVDYFTFANQGVDPAGIDPRTVRVFAGTNLPLQEELDTVPASFMTECALKDLGNDDDVFDLNDRFLFWAHAPFGWANEFDSSRSRTEYVENEYGDVSYYWITWESALGAGGFGTGPRRMGKRSVADSTATPPFARSTPHRIHTEQNNSENFDYPGEDGWMWEDLRGRGTNRSYPLSVINPRSGDGILTARMCSHQASRSQRRVELKLAGQVTGSWQWTHGSSSAVFDVTGCWDALLQNGTNLFQVNASFPADDTVIDHVFTTWFDVEYDRQLDAEEGRYLHFFSDADSLALPVVPFLSPMPCTALPDSLVYGRTAFRLEGFDSPPQDIHLFDVSDQHGVVDLTDFTVSGGAGPHAVVFSDPGLTGTRWYVACTMEGVKTLPRGEFPVFADLRDPIANEASYLVIYNPAFAQGAQRLADLRSQRTALVGKAVNIEDIYDEFGWGMEDPVAVRDFLRAAQDWVLAPLYVVFVGDAAFDTKGNLTGSPTNWFSTYTRRYRDAFSQVIEGENVDFYSTDDYFGYLDQEDYTVGQPALDVAIGRLPVANPDELDRIVDKVESYLSGEDAGPWQNRMLLVADDTRVLDEFTREKQHTQQVEQLARERIPESIDQIKVYLVDFPRNDFGKKPEAQQKFIDEFTRGALMTTYTGHGDQNTMAQEEVFVSQKVGELLNGKRYTIFSTFSCQVSRFDLLSGDSMTELLLKHEDGGAVTTFASGGLVYPTQSATLNQTWLGSMFGTPYITGTHTHSVRTLGLSALVSKVLVGTAGLGHRKNDEKYVLLGDPALSVRYGRMAVEFEPATVDSQNVEELLRVIRGTVRNDDGEVLDGTLGTLPFSGNAWVHVTEDADTTGYDFIVPTQNGGSYPDHIDFTLEGSTIYRGEVPIVNGRFEARFHLNEGVKVGNRGRISVFALEDGGESRDASGGYNSLVLAPTISPNQVADSDGPLVRIGFQGYETFTSSDQIFSETPVLTVRIEDPNGVNLRPFPQFARLEAELDGEERLDLSDDFSFEKGSFTRGAVSRPLSLLPGRHTIRVKAYDNVGNRGEASASFTIVRQEADFDLVDRAVTTYPNPFAQKVDVVFQLTHDAEVSLKVFTITGRKIYEVPAFAAAAGTNTIAWNGEDENGLPLANGTYLYKLDARMTSGAAGDGPTHDEFVGRIVRMR
ncbi:T9SS type A sorting domain-containing protein [bacterium]|nr:T9SS type A sorting domain-containing protein [bacterium]